MKYTLEQLKGRHSVRNYRVASPIDEPTRNKLKAEITMINSHEPGFDFQLVFDDGAPFKGFARSYGFFKGVSNYLAAVVDPAFDHSEERAGYYAQQFVMYAVGLGLGTCFVSGTYSAKNVNAHIPVFEKLPFLVTFGYAEDKDGFIAGIVKKVSHRKERSPRDFFAGDDAEYDAALKKFPWLQEALEAVACAPSALNSQPARFAVKNIDGTERIVAYTIDPAKHAIDLGIAKFNFQCIAPGEWEWGENAAFIPFE